MLQQSFPFQNRLKWYLKMNSHMLASVNDLQADKFREVVVYCIPPA